MPRRFTAASSEMIRSASTSFAQAQNLNGSMFAVLRRTSQGAYENILYGANSGGSEQWTFELSDGNLVEIYNGGASISDSSFTVTTSDGWVLIGFTKASGTATPVFHKYVFSTGTWTHSNGSNSIDNGGTPGASGYLQAGLIRTVDPANFDLACVGVWSGTALTNAQVESLAAGFSAWVNLAPGMLWVLDQSATTITVRDWVGVTHEASKTGTSVSTSSAPIGYGGQILDSLFAPAAAGGTNASADVASSTVAANNAVPAVAPNADNASATGTANNAAPKVQPNAGSASATATANNATVTGTTTAGSASATGTANQGAANVQPNAGSASATASAYDATVDTATRTDAPAQVASATAAANDATVSALTGSGTASATGTANQPATKVTTNAAAASATATGQTPAPAVSPNAATATATATANNATVTTSSAGSATAQAASATAAAHNATVSVKASAGSATATAAANGATVTVGVSATAAVATVTATALGPSIAIAVSAAAAAATATANDPTIQAGVIEVVVYDVTGQVVYQASHPKEVFTVDGSAVMGATGRLVSGRGYP